MEMLPHEKALQKAKIDLMTKPDCAFFCDLVLSFKYLWDDTIQTAGVDGVNIFISPKFWMSLPPEERVGVLVHEVMHVVYDHITRKNGRDHTRWNIAGDHVINLDLLKKGFKLPSWALADTQYDGMTTDQVYDLLPANPPPPKMIDLMPSALGEEELKEFIEGAVIRASIRSQQENDKPGTIPGHIQLFIDRLLEPKIKWQTVLARYCTKFAKTEYSFSRPRRKYFPEFILPGMAGYAMQDIAVAVDISGSVSDEEFKQFVGEIGAIFRMNKPSKITLVQFDTHLKSVDELSGFQDLMKVQFKGRGGTKIQPVIEWAHANKPELLLVFTDGEFRFGNEHYKKDLLWLIHNNKRFKAPYGKTVHYTI